MSSRVMIIRDYNGGRLRVSPEEPEGTMALQNMDLAYPANNNKMMIIKTKSKRATKLKKANKKKSMGKMVASSGANFGIQPPVRSLQRLTLGTTGGLDEGGLRYLKLLSDPCNAAFTGPAYEGQGSGLFFRTRTLVSPPSGVDSVLQLCPNFIHDNLKGAVGVAQGVETSPIMYAYRETAGAVLGGVTCVPVAVNLFGQSEVVSGALVQTGGSFGSCRAVAACIKVGYNGSVMNLSGRVFGKITTQQTFSQASNVIGTKTFTDLMADSPQIDDLRSRTHEYRWVPAFDDQNWVQTPAGRASSGDTQFTADSVQKQGQTLCVGVMGAPSGTITYEVTIVWEAQVSGGANTDLLSTTTAPPTSSTLNHVLREIGNVGSWALSQKGQEQITGMFQGAGNLARTVKSGVADLLKLF